MRRLRLIDGVGSGPASLEDSVMKVAFATNDMKRVDAHFGGARNLAIYEVSSGESRFLEAVQFDREKVSQEDGRHEDVEGDRLSEKIEALRGCSLLFVLAIGGPAAARVVNSRVHPVKLPASEDILSVTGRVQTMLSGNPPPWLRKVLRDESQRMDFLDEDA